MQSDFTGRVSHPIASPLTARPPSTEARFAGPAPTPTLALALTLALTLAPSLTLALSLALTPSLTLALTPSLTLSLTPSLPVPRFARYSNMVSGSSTMLLNAAMNLAPVAPSITRWSQLIVKRMRRPGTIASS
jgi:hypothetical protein